MVFTMVVPFPGIPPGMAFQNTIWAYKKHRMSPSSDNTDVSDIVEYRSFSVVVIRDNK